MLVNYRTPNPQTFNRIADCAQELRNDLPRLSFDAGYCLDAVNLLPAGYTTALWQPVLDVILRPGA